MFAAAGVLRAQSAPPDDQGPVDQGSAAESSSFVSPASDSSNLPGDLATNTGDQYVPPTEEQKFHDFVLNAVGPVAFAGASFAAAIDQASDFPHKWGQGADAYSVRVASDLGISLVTATAQYSIAESLQEDTAYYRCTCTGFFPRFWHAAASSVTSRRGDDGHRAFSVALTVSPFIGPLTAANTWIPGRDGPMLGTRMGVFNLLGQFGQNESLEFLYGGPHTLLGHIKHRFFSRSQDADPTN